MLVFFVRPLKICIASLVLYFGYVISIFVHTHAGSDRPMTKYEPEYGQVDLSI